MQKAGVDSRTLDQKLEPTMYGVTILSAISIPTRSIQDALQTTIANDYVEQASDKVVGPSNK